MDCLTQTYGAPKRSTDGKILIFIFCCTAIAEFFNVTFFRLKLSFSTYVSLAFILLGLGMMVKLIAKDSGERMNGRKWLLLLVGWNVVTIVRGIYFAENYWDWKMLIFTNMPALLIPLVAFMGYRLCAIKDLLDFIRKYYFIAAFLLLLVVGLPSKIIYLWTPLYFFIIAYKYLPRRERIFIIILVAFLLPADLMARSSLIRVAVSIVIGLSCYWIGRHRRIVSLAQKVLAVLPFVLFFLALSGDFNIFDMESYMGPGVEVENVAGEKENFMADSRTFLYEECLSSMDRKDSFLFGEGGCGKYYTEAFKNALFGANRYASEVGVLNTLLYSGIIGVALYWIVFFIASYKAINDSENILSKMIGLFIIIRWDYFFVEEFTNFNTNYFFLWLMIGMCLTPQFRYMTDEDIREWIGGRSSR